MLTRLTVVISHYMQISNHYVVYLKLMLCYMSIISQFKNVFMHCFTKYNRYILKSMAFAPVRPHCSPHASPGLIRLRPYSGDSFHLEHPVSAFRLAGHYLDPESPIRHHLPREASPSGPAPPEETCFSSLFPAHPTSPCLTIYHTACKCPFPSPGPSGLGTPAFPSLCTQHLTV